MCEEWDAHEGVRTVRAGDNVWALLGTWFCLHSMLWEKKTQLAWLEQFWLKVKSQNVERVLLLNYPLEKQFIYLFLISNCLVLSANSHSYQGNDAFYLESCPTGAGAMSGAAGGSAMRWQPHDDTDIWDCVSVPQTLSLLFVIAAEIASLPLPGHHSSLCLQNPLRDSEDH